MLLLHSYSKGQLGAAWKVDETGSQPASSRNVHGYWHGLERSLLPTQLLNPFRQSHVRLSNESMLVDCASRAGYLAFVPSWKMADKLAGSACLKRRCPLAIKSETTQLLCYLQTAVGVGDVTSPSEPRLNLSYQLQTKLMMLQV